MDIEFFRNYCLQKIGVEECTPFGPDTLVFKVAGKMFALVGLENFPLTANLKCIPELALQWRLEYPGEVTPGYHMNKKHWNTVLLEGSIQDGMIKKWIDDSYSLVVKNLSKKEREAWDIEI